MELFSRNERIQNVEDWFRYAPPRGGRFHWRDGRSAKELAKTWFSNEPGPAPPEALVALLDTHSRFAGSAFHRGYPERRVPFDQIPGEPANVDLAVECSSDAGAYALLVEAKADEPFGPSVADIIMLGARDLANETRSGRLERVRGLARLLGRVDGGAARLGELRYQLLTNVAAAVAFAQEINASTALLLFHCFTSPALRTARLLDNERDLQAFIHRLSSGQVRTLSEGVITGPVPYATHGHRPVELFAARLVTPASLPGPDVAEAQNALDLEEGPPTV